MERKRFARASSGWRSASRRCGWLTAPRRRKPWAGEELRLKLSLLIAPSVTSRRKASPGPPVGSLGSRASCASITRRAGSRPRLANYLRSLDSGHARARRAAKSDQAKPDERKKAGAKPGEVTGGDRKPDGAAGDSKPTDGRPADIMAPERRTPAAGEARPAEGVGE